MPKWSDFGNIWSTLRELDVNAIREESECVLRIACVGHESAIHEIDQLLHRGQGRYPHLGAAPLELLPIAQAITQAADLNKVDLLILGIDAQQPLTRTEAESFGMLDQGTMPFLVVQVHEGNPTNDDTSLPPTISARRVLISDPSALDAADRLAVACLTRLPSDLHLAAARRLPGLRASVAQEMIASTSFTNATYALASGLPEQIPFLSIPFAAADILVLTKNQAILVYKIALAYGAIPDFQARIREVLPVVGGAFLWRQAARSLIGLIPVWGLLPKIAVAYAGTYTTGVAAWRWYESGEMVSTEQLKRISQDAIAIGRVRGAEIIARARTIRDQAAANSNSFLSRLREKFPWLRRKRTPTKQ